MTRHTLAAALLAVVVAAVTAGPAFAGNPPPVPTPPRAPAAPPPPAAPAGPFQGKRDEMRKAVQQKIQTYLTVELTSRLALDEKRSVKLSEAVKTHLERKHDHMKRLHDELEKLQGMLDGKATDAQMKPQLDIVLGAAGRDDDMQAFVVDTSKFLSVQEQAKLALALPDVLKDVHKMMKQARREMKHGGGFGGKDDDEE